jgi:hypothetical protein
MGRDKETCDCESERRLDFVVAVDSVLFLRRCKDLNLPRDERNERVEDSEACIAV